MTRSNDSEYARLRRVLLPVQAVPGITPLIGRIALMPKECLPLAERLLSVSCPAKRAPEHYFKVVHFVRFFFEAKSRDLTANEMQFRLIDLADYCKGLPAIETVVVFLRRVYQQYSLPRLRVAAAECVGNMWAGLPSASPLLIRLLSSPERLARNSAAQAVGRVLNTQSALAEEASEWGERFHSQYTSTMEQLAAFRRKVCGLAETHDLADIFTATGFLSDLGLLAEAQVSDEEFFRDNKMILLREHLAEFVAIRHGEILGFAKSPKAIDRLVNEKLGPDARAFVTKITPEAFGPAPTAIIF